MENKKRKAQEQRIIRYRGGDQKAFGELVDAYMPLMQSEVNRCAAGLSLQDAEDFSQIALTAFHRAVLGYDLSNNEVEFGLYAKICIENALRSALRAAEHKISVVELTEEVESEGGAEDPARRVLEEEALAELHTRIRRVLSPYENRVWNLYTAGYRSSEIAALLRKDSRSVENAVYRIRLKLRRALGGNG